MSNQIVAERSTGFRVIAGTVYSVTDSVRRHGTRWVATRGLCNGVADGATEYRTRRAALESLGLERGEETRILAADWEAIFVHGQTGQDREIQTLPAGTWIRDLRKHDDATTDADGESAPLWRALAAGDGGRCWYRYRAYGAPFVR